MVVSDSWSATNGTLAWFERTNGSWTKRGGPVPALLGRAGMAWGRGEANITGLVGPQKREGDDKAPAGVFRLGTAFGYAADPPETKMPYEPLTKNIVAVDDPQSRYYNQLVDATKVHDIDWRTAENMILTDNRYRWGVVVLHNFSAVPDAGSCIFLHCWKDPSTATSGCTAIAEENLMKLLRWLDPKQNPRLIQLPRSPYNELRLKWDFPELPGR